MRSRKLEAHLRKMVLQEVKRIYSHPRYVVKAVYGNIYVETYRKNGEKLNECHQIIQVTAW